MYFVSMFVCLLCMLNFLCVSVFRIFCFIMDVVMSVLVYYVNVSVLTKFSQKITVLPQLS